MITAVTKSGGNRWSGDVFIFYQDRGFVQTETSELGGRQKVGPEARPTSDGSRGLSVGGPIVKDKILVFGAYEENRQDRDSKVFLGGTPFPAILDTCSPYQGTFTSQFREQLAFGKAPTSRSRATRSNVSYSLRTESDMRGFGGTEQL